MFHSLVQTILKLTLYAGLMNSFSMAVKMLPQPESGTRLFWDLARQKHLEGSLNGKPLSSKGPFKEIMNDLLNSNTRRDGNSNEGEEASGIENEFSSRYLGFTPFEKDMREIPLIDNRFSTSLENGGKDKEIISDTTLNFDSGYNDDEIIDRGKSGKNGYDSLDWWPFYSSHYLPDPSLVRLIEERSKVSGLKPKLNLVGRNRLNDKTSFFDPKDIGIFNVITDNSETFESLNQRNKEGKSSDGRKCPEGYEFTGYKPVTYFDVKKRISVVKREIICLSLSHLNSKGKINRNKNRLLLNNINESGGEESLLDWKGAQDQCKGKSGGTLLTISDDYDTAHLAKVLTNIGCQRGEKGRRCGIWLAGSRGNKVKSVSGRRNIKENIGIVKRREGRSMDIYSIHESENEFANDSARLKRKVSYQKDYAWHPSNFPIRFINNDKNIKRLLKTRIDMDRWLVPDKTGGLISKKNLLIDRALGFSKSMRAIDPDKEDYDFDSDFDRQEEHDSYEDGLKKYKNRGHHHNQGPLEHYNPARKPIQDVKKISSDNKQNSNTHKQPDKCLYSEGAKGKVKFAYKKCGDKNNYVCEVRYSNDNNDDGEVYPSYNVRNDGEDDDRHKYNPPPKMYHPDWAKHDHSWDGEDDSEKYNLDPYRASHPHKTTDKEVVTTTKAYREPSNDHNYRPPPYLPPVSYNNNNDGKGSVMGSVNFKQYVGTYIPDNSYDNKETHDMQPVRPRLEPKSSFRMSNPNHIVESSDFVYDEIGMNMVNYASKSSIKKYQNEFKNVTEKRKPSNYNPYQRGIALSPKMNSYNDNGRIYDSVSNIGLEAIANRYVASISPKNYKNKIYNTDYEDINRKNELNTVNMYNAYNEPVLKPRIPFNKKEGLAAITNRYAASISPKNYKNTIYNEDINRKNQLNIDIYNRYNEPALKPRISFNKVDVYKVESIKPVVKYMHKKIGPPFLPWKSLSTTKYNFQIKGKELPRIPISNALDINHRNKINVNLNYDKRPKSYNSYNPYSNTNANTIVPTLLKRNVKNGAVKTEGKIPIYLSQPQSKVFVEPITPKPIGLQETLDQEDKPESPYAAEQRVRNKVKNSYYEKYSPYSNYNNKNNKDITYLQKISAIQRLERVYKDWKAKGGKKDSRLQVSSLIASEKMEALDPFIMVPKVDYLYEQLMSGYSVRPRKKRQIPQEAIGFMNKKIYRKPNKKSFHFRKISFSGDDMRNSPRPPLHQHNFHSIEDGDKGLSNQYTGKTGSPHIAFRQQKNFVEYPSHELNTQNTPNNDPANYPAGFEVDFEPCQTYSSTLKYIQNSYYQLEIPEDANPTRSGRVLEEESTLFDDVLLPQRDNKRTYLGSKNSVDETETGDILIPISTVYDLPGVLGPSDGIFAASLLTNSRKRVGERRDARKRFETRQNIKYESQGRNKRQVNITKVNRGAIRISDPIASFPKDQSVYGKQYLQILRDGFFGDFSKNQDKIINMYSISGEHLREGTSGMSKSYEALDGNKNKYTKAPSIKHKTKKMEQQDHYEDHGDLSNQEGQEYEDNGGKLGREAYYSGRYDFGSSEGDGYVDDEGKYEDENAAYLPEIAGYDAWIPPEFDFGKNFEKNNVKEGNRLGSDKTASLGGLGKIKTISDEEVEPEQEYEQSSDHEGPEEGRETLDDANNNYNDDDENDYNQNPENIESDYNDYDQDNKNEDDNKRNEENEENVDPGERYNEEREEPQQREEEDPQRQEKDQLHQKENPKRQKEPQQQEETEKDVREREDGERENDEEREGENDGDRERENDGDRERENDGDRERENDGDRERENDGDRERENDGDRERENDGDRERENDGEREREDEERERENDEERERENDEDSERENDEDSERENDKSRGRIYDDGRRREQEEDREKEDRRENVEDRGRENDEEREEPESKRERQNENNKDGGRDRYNDNERDDSNYDRRRDRNDRNYMKDRNDNNYHRRHNNGINNKMERERERPNQERSKERNRGRTIIEKWQKNGFEPGIQVQRFDPNNRGPEQRQIKDPIVSRKYWEGKVSGNDNSKQGNVKLGGFKFQRAQPHFKGTKLEFIKPAVKVETGRKIYNDAMGDRKGDYGPRTVPHYFNGNKDAVNGINKNFLRYHEKRNPQKAGKGNMEHHQYRSGKEVLLNPGRNQTNSFNKNTNKRSYDTINKFKNDDMKYSGSGENLVNANKRRHFVVKLKAIYSSKEKDGRIMKVRNKRYLNDVSLQSADNHVFMKYPAYHAHPSNPTKYIQCSIEGYGTVMDCSPGTEWDQ
ncbi:unnamed protein product, partial [Gordionus sp. m RMFG-2023]